MMRALLVSALLLASTTLASAGGYIGAGIGPAPDIDGTDGHVQEGGRSARLLAGFRLARLSIEGSITGQGLTFVDNGRPSYEGRQLGLYGKYNHPLGSNFEVYGKIGVHRTWFNAEMDAYGVDGEGLLLGGGAEYRLNAILASASIWVDYTHHSATLEGDVYEWDTGVGMWMLGFTIGI